MVNDLNVTNRKLEPRWCHQHERLECARIDGIEAGPAYDPRCCHQVATDGPWCRYHVPARAADHVGHLSV